MLDAAAVGQLHNGAPSAARRRPSDHTCSLDAAPGHGHAEDPWEAGEERRLAAAWEASSVPPTSAADLLLQPPLEARAIAGVVREVDVELLHGTVPRRVHHEGAICPTTERSSNGHPSVVVAGVPGVDALHAGAHAPHLLPALSPTMPTAGSLQEREQLRGVHGHVAIGEVALGEVAHVQGPSREIIRNLALIRARIHANRARAPRLRHVLYHIGGAAPSQRRRGGLLSRGGHASQQEDGGGPHRRGGVAEAAGRSHD
mmetsp:Transcript_63463/g.177611  ORF Transcript_63463/g.177611 Transcript_63463/m.177611 type:complete len:258 (+) Transcript_63463:257-1030(+)